MIETVKIRYAEKDILKNDERTVNIVYYVEETGNRFGLAYHMYNSEDLSFMKKLLMHLNVTNFGDMINRDIDIQDLITMGAFPKAMVNRRLFLYFYIKCKM